MTEPTTEELVERLKTFAEHGLAFQRKQLLNQAAQRLSDLEGKLGEARKALEPFASITPSSFYADDGSEAERYTVLLYDSTRHGGPHDFTGADLAKAREALKLTASGGGEDNSLSSAAEHSIAFGSVETAAQHSSGKED